MKPEPQQQAIVYKIRNKETGEWSSGVNDYWSDSFLHTTIYDSPAPAKAVLTKIKKLIVAYKDPRYGYSEKAWTRYEAFLEKAEIVCVKLTIEEMTP